MRKPGMNRYALIGLLLMAVLGRQYVGAQANTESAHTNFIIILADDLGYGDLGCYGGAQGYETPALDRMAQEGMRFTDFYAPDTVCTPSRAGLLTGRFAMRMNADMGIFFPWHNIGMPSEEVTIAEMLKAEGYATALVGKWHLGHCPEFLPTAQGFDSYFGIPYSNDMSQDGDMPLAKEVTFFEGMTLKDYQSYKPRAKAAGNSQYKGGRDPQYKAFRNQVPLVSGTEVIEWPVDQSQLTKRYTEKAIAFIEGHKEQPFFLYLAHTMPHIPIFASEPFKGKTERGLYGDVIEELDWSTGQVLETLRKNGLDKNTVVVFTSDNGPWKSKKENGGCAGPLRDGKGSSYEGGFRVPGIFWHPGSIPAGTTTDYMSSALDLLPTFAAMSGAQLPNRKLDGFDISQVLAGKKGVPQPELFVYSSKKVIRMGAWKYRQGKTYGMWSGMPKDIENPIVEQLFNLEDDLGEQTNLIDQYPEKTAELKQRLEKYRKRVALGAVELQPSMPRFTAEQVLNGELPGRKASPVIEVKHNREGFAEERLYSVPAPGMHPRVLFGPEDLPRIRAQFQTSDNAAEILGQLRQKVDKDLHGPDGWGSEVFETMVAGDVDAFTAIWNDPRNPKKSGPPGHGAHPLLSALMDKAFLALIDDDRESGKQVAAAVATYAKFLLPRVEEAAAKPGGEHFWLSVRAVMGDSATVGFMYDFAQPFMTPEQAEVTRMLIATAIKDRYGLGMDLPKHWINWNFIGMGLYYPLLALSIEGEPGYDPRIYARGCEVTQNYVLYGNSANGVGKEAMGYHTAGMTHTAIMMLAMANRGENLFTLERWRRMFDTWCIYAMQPYGGEWQSSGDLGTFPPSVPLVDAARFLFPADERIAFVEQNLPDRRRLKKPLDVRVLQWLCPAGLDEDIDGLSAEKFELPKTLFDEERGMLYVRTGWDAEDLSLQVTCRSDTTFAAHDHADRGAFYFSSHGQAWAVSSMRMIEPKYLNQITIDGRGQGFFAPPGKWIEMSDTPEATVAVMDTDYCYDWQWQKTAFMSTDEQLEKEPWLEVFRPHRDHLHSRFPREQWERDPLPVVKDYYDGYLAGNPRMWGAEDSWVVRAPHNPVEKSFRTILMAKGKHPYLLICDDIKKDNVERLYTWRMRIPNTIEPYEMDASEVLLGSITNRRYTKSGQPTHITTGKPLLEKGEPMLLVRVLQANQPDIPKFQDNLTVETLNFVKHDDTFQYSGRKMGMGKRLVIPSRSVEPEYKILLFPYRHGDALPITEITEDGKTLTIEWDDQKDVYHLNVDEAGRTHLQRKRK